MNELEALAERVEKVEGADREAAYHWEYSAHRSHGEWFTRCPEMMAEIERLSCAN